jgi:hypothetical protein
VPVAEVSALEDTRRAREAYEKAKTAQCPFVGPESANELRLRGGRSLSGNP